MFKVDPTSNDVVGSQDLGDCYPVIATAGAVWVGQGDDDGVDNRLTKIDAHTLDELGEVNVGPCCMSGVAFASGDLWVGRQEVANVVRERDAQGRPLLDMDLAVLRIDPGEMRVVGEVRLEGDTYRPRDTLLTNTMASDGRAVWLTRPEAGVLERIDAAQQALSLSVKLDQLRLPDTPVVGPGWVASLDLDGSRIALVDADSGAALDVYDTRRRMQASAGTHRNSLWIADPDRSELIRLEVVRE